MMAHGTSNTPFTLRDLEALMCPNEGCYQLDHKPLGLRFDCSGIDDSLLKRSVYDFLYYLRSSIFEYGVIEFANLKPNLSNYTLAQGAPDEHIGNPNPYMTAHYQDLHQDTPPYPTAFGLQKPRRFYATWLTGEQQMLEFYQEKARQQESLSELHQRLVPASLQAQRGILINQNQGLTIIDNSNANKLYHARTINFAHHGEVSGKLSDSKMYAFNEIGLTQHLQQLDIHRGTAHINNDDIKRVQQRLLSKN